MLVQRDKVVKINKYLVNEPSLAISLGTIRSELATFTYNNSVGIGNEYTSDKFAQVPICAGLIEYTYDSEDNTKFDIKSVIINPDSYIPDIAEEIKSIWEDAYRLDQVDFKLFHSDIINVEELNYLYDFYENSQPLTHLKAIIEIFYNKGYYLLGHSILNFVIPTLKKLKYLTPDSINVFENCPNYADGSWAIDTAILELGCITGVKPKPNETFKQYAARLDPYVGGYSLRSAINRRNLKDCSCSIPIDRAWASTILFKDQMKQWFGN